MENIIKELEQAKFLIMSGQSEKAIDNINLALHQCTDLRDVIEAMQEPTPGQEDLLPCVTADGGKIVINAAEGATINVFSGGEGNK